MEYVFIGGDSDHVTRIIEDDINVVKISVDLDVDHSFSIQAKLEPLKYEEYIKTEIPLYAGKHLVFYRHSDLFIHKALQMLLDNYSK